MRKIKNIESCDDKPINIMIKQLREGSTVEKTEIPEVSESSENSDNFIIPKVINSAMSMFPYQRMNSNGFPNMNEPNSPSFINSTKDELSPSIIFNSYMN